MDDQVAELLALLPEAWGKPVDAPLEREPIVTVRFVYAPQQTATWISNLLASVGVAQVDAYTVSIEPRDVPVRKGPAQSFPVATIKVWVAP